MDHRQQIAELVKDMADRRVKVLVILSGNPVYTAPVFPIAATRNCRPGAEKCETLVRVVAILAGSPAFT